uniref:Ig-like domain-containing protein n=1 Tax=Mastacembelus armatus TaxID=205130 RepID=A0A3Q3N6F4_9TELE
MAYKIHKNVAPDSKAVQPGQSLTITCQVSGYSLTDSSYATGWIRQPEGKPMEWILNRWGGGDFYQNDALKNKFKYHTHTSISSVTLTGLNLQPEDTAVYYCVRGVTVTQTLTDLHKNPLVHVTETHNHICSKC